MKPPYIIFFTPSGRFEIKEKICLSFTNYHPEYWQPAWTIQNILVALVSFFPVNEDQLAIGAIRASKQERVSLAERSKHWKCEICDLTNKEIADQFMSETTADAVKELEKSNILAGELASGGFKTKEKPTEVKKEESPKIEEESKTPPAPKKQETPRLTESEPGIEPVETKEVINKVSKTEHPPDFVSPATTTEKRKTDKKYGMTPNRVKESKRRNYNELQRDLDLKRVAFRMKKVSGADPGMTDVENAKLKAAKIREDSQIKYNLRLLKELEADKSRKLMVVNVLMVLTLAIVGVVFLLFEKSLTNQWFDNLLR